jgi:hypothetical protein
MSVPGAALTAAPDAGKPVPAPAEMQERVWSNMVLADCRMEGSVRTEKQSYEILLRTRGREMIYEFPKDKLQIRVIMTESGSLVQRRAEASQDWVLVSGPERQKPVLGSDLIYEDLGVNFLRWSQVKPLGGDSIKTLDAWAYEASAPVPGLYAKAWYWISSKYLAVLRVDVFNASDEIIKRVEVNGVKKVGNVYVMEQMMVASMIPGRDLAKSKTFIQINKAEEGSGL